MTVKTIDRFRVHGKGKTFNDAGPDLLRKRSNARRQVSADMGPLVHDGWFVRRITDGAKTEWSGPMSKHDALAKFDAWKLLADGFVLGREDAHGVVEAHVVIQHEEVRIIDTADCGPETILGRSLIEHQFPGIKFAGGYVYKQIDGSSSWSDHAYGDAIDETENPPKVQNDDVLDWCARMGATGNMEFDYALGSRDGHVVETVAPDFHIAPSTAASSHLWHCHISFINHHGVKPGHVGGY